MTTSGLAFETAHEPVVEPGTFDYTTNNFNQYTSIQYSVSSIRLTYDLDGNLTNDGTFQYDYDAENRLISATPLDTASGLKKVEFAYDYMSRRVQKQVYTYDGSSWVLETEKSFVYDGWNLIKEQTTAGGTTSTDYYVWGFDFPAPYKAL